MPAAGVVSVHPLQGAYRFPLRSGRAAFQARRRTRPGGLRLTLLPGGPALDLLPHVDRPHHRSRRRPGERHVPARRRASAGLMRTIILHGVSRHVPDCSTGRWRPAPHGAAPRRMAGRDRPQLHVPMGCRKPATPAVSLYTGAAPSATALDLPVRSRSGEHRCSIWPISPPSIRCSPHREPRTPTNGPVPRSARRARQPGRRDRAAASATAFPHAGLSGLPGGTVRSPPMNSYLLLGQGRPGDEAARRARRFLNALGAIYPLIQRRPALRRRDWQRLARAPRAIWPGRMCRSPWPATAICAPTYRIGARAPELITQLERAGRRRSPTRAPSARTPARGGCVAMLLADLPTLLLAGVRFGSQQPAPAAWPGRPAARAGTTSAT